MRLQLTLCNGEGSVFISFPLAWAARFTVLHFAAEQLAMFTVLYQMPDDELAYDDLLLYVPVLNHNHLHIYISTLF